MHHGKTYTVSLSVQPEVRTKFKSKSTDIQKHILTTVTACMNVM